MKGLSLVYSGLFSTPAPYSYSYSRSRGEKDISTPAPSSTAAPEIAVVGKNEVAKAPENRYGYTLPQLSAKLKMLRLMKWNVTPLLGDFGWRVGYCGIL